MQDVSELILKRLVNDENFCRKTLPFLKSKYFEGKARHVFDLIINFVIKYNRLPNCTALEYELMSCETVSREGKDFEIETHAMIKELYEKSDDDEKFDEAWLLETTEKWCKDRAVYLAVIQAINIIDGKDKQHAPGAIPDILSKALAVTFDRNIGHDYIDNSLLRYDFYHKQEDRIPFDLEMFNTITGGGIARKTLNILLAGCVHPETKIKVRIRHKSNIYEEQTIEIGKIPIYMTDYDIEVESPDGWVKVTDFVNKGIYDEYIFRCNGKTIKCNEDHLFQCTTGWLSAKHILHIQKHTDKLLNFLCDDNRYHEGCIDSTSAKIPIVDITVDHQNHRYYTNGVSSHNTGVGKSLALCHIASSMLSQGRTVLYITLEMAEERIAERIDANLFDINIQNITDLTKDEFKSKINSIKSKTNGRLIIKEYPTAAAHTGHFRGLVDELKLKKNFVPDAIFIDYLNICASSRLRGIGGAVNSYSHVKAIAEELRGFAIEQNVPIWSATQLNREGFKSSDVDLTNTSESFGIPATADFMCALISNEKLESLNQILVKQLKNRYNDMTKNRRFIVGIDKSKMRLYDVEQSAQDDLIPAISDYVTKENTSSSDFSEFKME